MNKSILSIVALVTFVFANAQVKEKGTIEITPKIGSSSFSEYNQDNDSNDLNSGIELGATADYYFNNRWSLRTGFVFDKMGGKYSETSYYDFINFDPEPLIIPTTYYYEDQLNYLSIPINANWHFGSTRKWNLNFGLSPSFLMSAKLKQNGYTTDLPKSTIESFQLGLSFGIGYKIGITEKFGILIDAQWFSGITDISRIYNYNIQNSGFSYNLGGVIQL